MLCRIFQYTPANPCPRSVQIEALFCTNLTVVLYDIWGILNGRDSQGENRNERRHDRHF